MLDFISLTVSNKSMFKKCFVSLVVLWSWQNAAAVVHSPFEFFNAQKEKETVDLCTDQALKMPPMRSQDSLPICPAFSSAAVVQFQVCKRIPRACEDGVPTSAKTTVSPLSTLSWMRTNSGKGVQDNAGNFKNLQFFYEGNSGAADALSNASFTPTFFADSCFPFDQFVNKYGDSRPDDIKKVIQLIEKEYTKAKLEGDGICEDCLKGSALEGAATSLGISATDIASKLVESKKENDTPGQFLQKLMLGKCPDIISFRPSQTPKFASFPKNPADFTYDKLIGKIKEVLSGGNPLTLDGICIGFDNKGKCKTYHSVAISGYRNVCKKVHSAASSADPKEKQSCRVQCRDVVKVHNSWGADWQKNLEIEQGQEVGDGEGWVDAKKLTEYITKNKSMMENVLAWYY